MLNLFSFLHVKRGNPQENILKDLQTFINRCLRKKFEDILAEQMKNSGVLPIRHLWNKKLSVGNGSGLDIIFERIPQP
jgi:hypothetical protein